MTLDNASFSFVKSLASVAVSSIDLLSILTERVEIQYVLVEDVPAVVKDVQNLGDL